VAGGKSSSSATSAASRPCSRTCFSIETQYNKPGEEQVTGRRRRENQKLGKAGVWQKNGRKNKSTSGFAFSGHLGPGTCLS
jgi:hypothetical protein